MRFIFRHFPLAFFYVRLEKVYYLVHHMSQVSVITWWLLSHSSSNTCSPNSFPVGVAGYSYVTTIACYFITVFISFKSEPSPAWGSNPRQSPESNTLTTRSRPLPCYFFLQTISPNDPKQLHQITNFTWNPKMTKSMKRTRKTANHGIPNPRK